MIRWAESKNRTYALRPNGRGIPRPSVSHVRTPLSIVTEKLRGLERLPATARALFIAIAVAGLQLAMSWPLLHRQITTDESFTYFTVAGGTHELARGIRSDGGMIAYYGPLWLVQHVTGDSIVRLRLVSYACAVLLIVIVCLWAVRRGRLLAAALGLVTFGATRAMREAVVDARAAVPIALGAIITIGLLHRAHRRRRWSNYAAVSIAATLVAFGHPSAVGVSTVVSAGAAVDTIKPPSVRGRRWISAAVAGPLLAIGIAVLSTPSIPEPGVNAGTFVGNHYFGSSWLLTLVMLVAAAAVAWTTKPSDYALRTSIIAGLMWCPAIVMLAYLHLPMPRYFVVAVACATVGVSLVVTGWKAGAVGALAVLSLAGSALHSDVEDQNQAQWCSAADALIRDVGPGETVVFAEGLSRTPTFACMSAIDRVLFVGGHVMVPPIEAVESADPRSLWVAQPTGLATSLPQDPAAIWIVWTGAGTAEAAPAISALRAQGRACVDQDFSPITLTRCEAFSSSP